MSWARRLLHRLLSTARPGRAETELGREVEAHLRLLEDEFLAKGFPAEDARAAARRAFGGVEQAKSRQRDERGFRWLAGWSMDLRLGVRMLVKYPGLTLAGGLAIAFAIAAGAAGFEAVSQLAFPSLPLQDGDRIVGLRTWDVAAGQEHPRAGRDFVAWREQLRAVEDIGGFRTVELNLIAGDNAGEPAAVAEMSASGFRLARVAPLLGRVLVDADEHAGAPPVVVLGHDVWQRRLGGDRAALGRTIRLGSTEATVVGVMPPGFSFPVSHGVWIPLRPAGGLEVARGPAVRVFGRLAPGVTARQAQAALDVIVSRAVAASGDPPETLRAEVLPYARSVLDLREMSLGGAAVNVFLVMFLVLVCANVAALVFSRAIARQGEIVVRTALGARRARIVLQLFAEALVLGGVAAGAGLLASVLVLRWWLDVFSAEAGGRLPFWLNARLSPTTLLYAGGLTVVGAVIAGVLPAIKVTGLRLEGRLREAAAGGSDAQFRGAWTAVVVAQVAVTVAFPATAFFARQYVAGVQSLDAGFPARQYLSSRLETGPEGAARFEAVWHQFERRLAADPAVAGVTFADRLPRTSHPRRLIEADLEPGAADGDAAVERRACIAAVAVDFFDVLGAPILAGRNFRPADAATPARVVVVNRSFVERVLGGRNPVGRRVRYARERYREPSPWYEVVGVVPDLGMIHDDPRNGAGLYHPVPPGAAVVNAMVRLKGEPEAFAQRFREIATAVDPDLRLYDVGRLDKAGATLWMEMDFLSRLLALVSAVALLLSLVGIYSIVSFAVSRRTREIGIRVALGADPRRILVTVFSRAVRQVAIGIAAGGLLVLVLTQLVTGLSPAEAGVVAGYMALMMAVCMLACIVPARRALAVQPTETLREQ